MAQPLTQCTASRSFHPSNTSIRSLYSSRQEGGEEIYFAVDPLHTWIWLFHILVLSQFQPFLPPSYCEEPHPPDILVSTPGTEEFSTDVYQVMTKSPPHSLAHSDPATSMASEPPPDRSSTTSAAQTPHWKLATDAHTAALKLFSFVADSSKNKDSFAEDSKTCLDCLTAAGATAAKSQLATIFCEFDNAWENIPYYCHQLTDDKAELDTLIDSVICLRRELGITAFDPTGQADPLKVDHYWIESDKHNSTSDDTDYHILFN
jgi:hypothetical protein